MKENVIYWDGLLPVELPDRTKVIKVSFLPRLNPVENVEEAVNEALSAPYGMKTIPELVKPGKKVTIAFDDPCIPGDMSPLIFPVLREVKKAGVSKGDIKLLCATGLHRHWMRRELSRTIGREVVEEFGFRLLCHDAEDEKNLVYLGESKNGYEVEVNKLVADSDLLIYVNSMSNLFNGGWKSVCVGLGTYRSIKYTHGPGQLMGVPMEVRIDPSRDPLHGTLNEMGEKIEESLGKQIFKIETVRNNNLEVARVFAGTVPLTREKSLEAQATQVVMDFSGLEQSDVLIYGLPRWMPYATYSETNPILNVIGMGLGYLAMPIELMLKKGGALIMISPCPDVWDKVHHPSYIEAWNRVMRQTLDPYEIRDRFEEDFAHRPEYIYKYRYCFAYHPVHALFVLYWIQIAQDYIGKVFVAGAQDPRVIRHMGFEPTETVEEAIEKVEGIFGKDCSISCMKYEFPGVKTLST